MSVDRRAEQSKIRLHFVIIGAGVAGLSCAIALSRIGHRVTVIECKDDITGPQVGFYALCCLNPSNIRVKDQRGVRMPPNLTKILFHWGLKEKLRATSVKSEAIHIVLEDTGELLGTQLWDEEILQETRGEYIFGHLSDLIALLYDEAISQGAEIYLGTAALAIDAEHGRITTDVDGILEADVIIGADGISGLVRRVLLGEQRGQGGNETVAEPADHPSMWMYNALVPKQNILDTGNELYGQPHSTLFLWLGNGRSTLGYPVGPNDDFAIIGYTSYDPEGSSMDTLKKITEDSEPRLKNLFPLVSESVRRKPVMECEPLEDWVSQHGRLILVGTGAHPIPPGSVQESAMSLEDGAVLARLFTHLLSRDQITQFLWAFQDIRQTRCGAVAKSATNCMHYMCMPKGEEQEARDATMRAKKAAGVQVLQAGGDQEETPEWQEVKEVFGYDAEDEADNWWIGWGSLKYKSAAAELGGSIGIQVEQTVSNHVG
ncbi:hypothetical protein K438DRAFT_1987048 [Mycena galopus ATCC 62051]|nr:hypothetical protein K438DRAFT_1987048 [Mycena galopus ATCC 62051]